MRGTTVERAHDDRPAASVADTLEGGLERHAMDRLFGLYLLVSGAALALGVPPFDGLTTRLAALAPRLTSLLHDWYPLAAMPWLYMELATLNVAVWGGRYFDSVILAADQALFGTQPSVALSRALPYLALSEPLHAAYLSYYAIIYGPPLALYLLGRRGDFRRLVFPLMLTFFVHYLFFVYFPVSGPRYLFPPPGGELARGPVYQLAHHLLEGGSSRGAAFPSSHVAVSTAMTILCFRYLPRAGPFVAIAAAGLAFGAVYAGFHYATDAMVGLVMGILIVVFAAPAVGRLLGGRRGER